MINSSTERMSRKALVLRPGQVSEFPAIYTGALAGGAQITFKSFCDVNQCLKS